MLAMRFKTKSGLPDAIERRELLDGSRRDATDLDELGGLYQQAGLLSDALDCFERTKNAGKLEELKAIIIESDPFLLLRLDACAFVEVSTEDWLKAARHAESTGRHIHALRAYERAGDEAGKARVTESLNAFAAAIERPRAGRRALRETPAADAEGAPAGAA